MGGRAAAVCTCRRSTPRAPSRPSPPTTVRSVERRGVRLAQPRNRRAGLLRRRELLAAALRRPISSCCAAQLRLQPRRHRCLCAPAARLALDKPLEPARGGGCERLAATRASSLAAASAAARSASSAVRRRLPPRRHGSAALLRLAQPASRTPAHEPVEERRARRRRRRVAMRHRPRRCRPRRCRPSTAGRWPHPARGERTGRLERSPFLWFWLVCCKFGRVIPSQPGRQYRSEVLWRAGWLASPMSSHNPQS